MNILVVQPFPCQSVGGVISAVRYLSREMTEIGGNVSVLNGGLSPALIRLDDIAGVPNYTVYLRSVQTTKPRTILSFLVFLPVTLWRLWRFLSKNNIDAIHIHYPSPQHVYFGILRRFCYWRLILTFQGSDAHGLHELCWLKMRLMKLLLSSADGVSTVSESLLIKVKRRFPSIRFRSKVIPNGAAIPQSAHSATPPYSGDFVVTAAKLIPRKGIDTLLLALRILKNQGEVPHLLIVGDGPERTSLEDLAQELHIADDVEFLGDQPHAVAMQMISKCRFFVLSSRAEGLPLVVAEAMMCGKAVIATNVDGTPDIVRDQETGILIHPDSPEELASAIQRLWNDPQLCDRYAQAGKTVALNRFQWSTIAAEYLEFVNSHSSGTKEQSEGCINSANESQMAC